jgi:hypothetical protein
MGFGSMFSKILFWALMVSGVAMTTIDAGLSVEWIALQTNAGRVYPHFPLILAFVVASITSGMGAIVTNPSSWYYVLTGGKKIASIDDPMERGMCVLGIGFLAIFLITGVGSAIAIDVVSNYYKTRNWPFAIAIVFGGDICFLIANVVYQMLNSRPAMKVGR